MDDYYKPKYGPIHFAAIGFNRTNVVRGMVEQLDLVREAGIIRLIDFLFVEKDDYGNIKALETIRCSCWRSNWTRRSRRRRHDSGNGSRSRGGRRK